MPPRWTASEQINQQFFISVTNPVDGATLPSVVMVESLNLDTADSRQNDAPAPPGTIFLTLQATSGPPQHSFGQADNGHFFSNMTPLAASAITFTSRAGHVFDSFRSDAVNQTSNPNSASQDGLVDATYSFVVPISTHSGLLTIHATSTRGVEYKGFVGGSPTQLDIGGPTSIPISFTKLKRITTSKLASNTLTASTSYDTFSELFTILAWLTVAAAYLRLRRRSNAVKSAK